MDKLFKHGIACEHANELQATHQSLGTKTCACVRGEVGGVRNDTEQKCACELVCMKDCLAQSKKDIEPAIHQMTCGPKANKMAICCPAAIFFDWSCFKDSAHKTF